jgi:hypothetical protein
MGSAGVGLILGLGFDAGAADQALAEFATRSDSTFTSAAAGVNKTTDAGEALNKKILSNRESARLLSEELGVHMPRAVTGAIAKMMPDIEMLGGALLGVFAVEKVYEWSVAAIDDFHKVMRSGETDIEDLDAAATNAFKHMKEEAGKIFTDFKTTDAGAFQIAAIDARAEQLLKYHAAYVQWEASGNQSVRDFVALGAETMRVIAKAKSEGLNNLKETDQKIAETGQLQFEAHKHLAQLTAQDEKDANAAAEKVMAVWKRNAREAAEAKKRANKELAEDNAFTSAWLEKCEKQDEATLKAGTLALLHAINKRTKAQAELAASLAQINAQLEASLSVLPSTLKALGTELPNQLPKLKEWSVLLHDLTTAQDDQNKGLAANAAFVAQNAASILDTLRAKREYAAVMAIYETAKGFEALGEWDFWGAAQDFASAAMYAKVAGTSNHKGGAGGAGGGGTRGAGRGSSWGDSASGGGQGVERAGGGSPSGGGSSSGGQTILQISGGKLNSNGQQQLAAWVGMGSAVGLFKFNSSGSSGIAASRY